MSLESAFYRYLPTFLRKTWDRIKASPIGYRLAHGTSWSMAGAGVSQSFLLLTSIIVARILGRQHTIGLKAGLQSAYDWYLDNQ